MTALHQFERLEAIGQWRPYVGAPQQEVIVGLGRQTLSVIDVQGTPVAHWSLGSLILGQTQNPHTIRLRVDPNAEESLFLSDKDMIAALRLIDQSMKPKTAFKKRIFGFGVLACAIAGLGWYGIQKLPDYVANNLPKATQTALGEQMILQLEEASGGPCTAAQGRDALAALEDRLRPLGPVTLHVLPIEADHVLSLPGGQYVIPETLIQRSTSPDGLAGHVIAAITNHLTHDSLKTATHAIGIWDNVLLLFTASAADNAANSAAQAAVDEPYVDPNSESLAQAFDITSINAAPYATGRGDEMLSSLNTHAAAPPVLKDGAFIGLKQICD
ncbi:MAG: hypothetical protein ACWA40_08300 [Planktomarina sp.]